MRRFDSVQRIFEHKRGFARGAKVRKCQLENVGFGFACAHFGAGEQRREIFKNVEPFEGCKCAVATRGGCDAHGDARVAQRLKHVDNARLALDAIAVGELNAAHHARAYFFNRLLQAVSFLHVARRTLHGKALEVIANIWLGRFTE